MTGHGAIDRDEGGGRHGDRLLGRTDHDQLAVDADGWTLRSADGSPTSHSEHTVAVTEDGAEVLTLPTPR